MIFFSWYYEEELMITLRNGLILLLLTLLLGCNELKPEKAQQESNPLDKQQLERNSGLLENARSGDEQLVKTLLTKGANINATDAEGWTPLHEASVSGHTEIAKLLIEKGAKINARDVDGMTPLLIASVNGQIEIVKLLIQKGAEIDAADNNGTTSLHGASVNGYNDIALLLIQNAANVNAKNLAGMTPLLMALSVNRIDMGKLLKDNGANLTLRNPGKVAGLVKDALTGKPLSGVVIKIFHQGKIFLKFEKTDYYGHYTFNLSEGHYILEMSYTGYIQAKVYVEVTHKETTTIATVRQVPQAYSGKGIANGQLLNAFNGKAVSNATLNIRAGINMRSGAVVATTKTDKNGNYRVNLSGGNYTIEATKKDYTTVDFPIVSIGKQTTDNQNASITPTINPGEIRIVLSWGAQPLDLDSYLLTPTIAGKTYNIFHNLRGQSSSIPNVQLDVDDTSSYGPETITIYQPFPGTYRYYVHNYNGRPPLTASDAKVEIFSAKGLLKSYNVPISGTGNYWQVFSYNSSTKKNHND